ncbi:hypothetical protein [Sphingobacterium sp. FBM7-1]|uniref:hypothetical protein n=1 Tax=Sphingobacterium sp. FBM7-1 TaxID=2886688 RepID=UPI001D1000A4|nr:hypothetical protein [Sphingobacterium sp. FBM7-1]MCC2600319.1 hypothetical protein [Sphingobacterium sp. FBM7-1]
MKVTKKIILFLFVGSLMFGGLFYSCQNEHEYFPDAPQVQSLGNRNKPTKAQVETLKKFDKVVDEKLSFQDGQFTLDIKSGSEIGLDQELFDYYQERLKERNEYLAQMIEEGFMPVEVKKNVIQFVDTKNKVGLKSVIINPEYPYTIPYDGLNGVSLTGLNIMDVYLSKGRLPNLLDAWDVGLQRYTGELVANELPFQASYNIAVDLAYELNSKSSGAGSVPWLNSFDNGMHIHEEHMYCTFGHQQVGTVVWLLEGSTN